MNPAIQQAVSAIKAGDKQKAYRLLARVIQEDPQGPQSEKAWILMSSIVEDPRRKRQSLEAALAINPDNEVAKQRLATLEQAAELEKPTGVIELQSVQHSAEDRREDTASAAVVDTVEHASMEEVTSTQQDSSSQTLPVRDLNISINPLQIIGLIGVFLLILGVFTPIVSLPIVGDMNYFQSGQGDGVFVLILAVASLAPIFLHRYQWLWITGLLALTLIGSTLLQFIWVIAQLRQTVTEETADNLFAGLAELLVEAVQIQWGWVLLVTGAVLVLVTAVLGRQGDWPRKHIAAGLISSFVLLSILIGIRVIGGNGLTADSLLGQSAVDRPETEYVSVGESVQYEAGTLRVLQVHHPTAFHVTERSALGHEGVERTSGVSYVSIEMEFTCSEATEVVCESVPEASLELELQDGRKVDDEWSIYDAPWLGEEDAVGGESTIGWRVFRVPQDAQLKNLIVEPFSDQISYHIELPETVDGYSATHSWLESDDGRVQLVPALRRRLQERDIDAPTVVRTEFDASGSSSAVEGGLYLELCADTSFYFDEDEAIAEHRTLILETLREAVDYHRGGELLLLNVNDCSSFSVSEISVGFRDTDLSRWQRGSFTDAELLTRAIVTLD